MRDLIEVENGALGQFLTNAVEKLGTHITTVSREASGGFGRLREASGGFTSTDPCRWDTSQLNCGYACLFRMHGSSRI